VPTAWPQDYVIGQGKSTKLYYDDMNMFEWTQGIFAIIEAEENVEIMRLMLAYYRDLFRDSQAYGFEAAKWTNGVVLSALEKGKFAWADTFRMADERRSALNACAPLRENTSAPPSRENRQSRSSQIDSSRSNGSRNQGKKASKVCAFHNNGTCTHAGHHESASTRWRHVCKECYEPGHVDKQCPFK
jgi:hypothetical protein